MGQESSENPIVGQIMVFQLERIIFQGVDAVDILP